MSLGGVVFFGQSLGAVQVAGMGLVAGAVGVWLARAPVEREPTPLEAAS